MDEKSFLESLKDIINETLINSIKNDPEVRDAIKGIFPEEKIPDDSQAEVIQELNNTIADLNSELEEKSKELEELKELYKEELGKKKERIKELKEKVEGLEGDIRKLESQKESLKGDKEKLNGDIKRWERLYNTLEEEKQTLEEEYRKYKKLNEAFDEYCSLDADIFENIIKSDSPESFLVSGTNITNINLVFEKIKLTYDKYPPETLDTINSVFDYLFEQFKNVNTEYERIETSVGDDFDLEQHSRTSDSLPSGKISRVIISGYTNQSGRTKQKSLVEVK